ncbi:hypothetical protein PED39_02635 [Methanomassiliicoccales archaeon LGM-RCC1]|jgi:predicted nucleic acid-binding Zn ribbon protein|nr:hypothetical protein [Candidatus Methanomethylophilaceae archaeon]MBR4685924.1 hypothetical protein [Candidatus Methanomethylophilaceae archaeon]WII08114.1 hypothetical protein PED39_02635 [Methanomassiliicoccales archaeon LGM-RCC1]
MKSLEERYEEITEDPKKFKKAFNIVWIVAYSMLMIGVFLIIWVLYTGQ